MASKKRKDRAVETIPSSPPKTQPGPDCPEAATDRKTGADKRRSRKKTSRKHAGSAPDRSRGPISATVKAGPSSGDADWAIWTPGKNTKVEIRWRALNEPPSGSCELEVLVGRSLVVKIGLSGAGAEQYFSVRLSGESRPMLSGVFRLDTDQDGSNQLLILRMKHPGGYLERQVLGPVATEIRRSD